MPLEVGTWVQDLVSSNPPGSDSVSQGANHLTLIKGVLQNTFPNATKALRFPNSVAAATTTVTIVFPTDQNKLFPINAAAGAVTVNLPDPTAGATVNEDGFFVAVFKTDATANAVTITPAGGQTINGLTTLKLTKAQYILLQWSKLNATWYYALAGNATVFPAPITKTANYTLQYSDDGNIIEVSNLPWTLTLPNSGLYAGFRCKIQLTGPTSTNALTISATGPPTIIANRGDLTAAVASLRMFGFGEVASIFYDGTNWFAELTLSDSERIGSVMMWMKETAPTAKWLLMHSAQNISRATYSELFALWGTNFGTGDGSTTFGIPNMAGRFLRAWDNANAIDPDRASRTDRGDGTTGDHIGTKQADALKDHTHPYTFPNTSNTLSIGGADLLRGTTPNTPTGSPSTGAAAETRGINIGVGYALKVLP